MSPWSLSLLAILSVPGAPAAKLPPNLAKGEAVKSQDFVGNVMPLADVLKKHGIKVDAGAGNGMVLTTTDGKVYHLLKDDGSRLFFLDKALHNRPMKLRARLLPGTQMLQVLRAHSLIKGRPHEIYYWCDHCLLRASEAGPCACCGGRTVLVEEPVR